MKATMKKTLGLLLVMAIIVGMAACAAPPPPTPAATEQPAATQEPTSAPVEKAKITIAIEATGDIPAEFQKQIDRFNASSETAEATILTYAGADTYETAITGQIAGQSAPDIIWLDGGKKIQDFVANGVIVPLNDYLGDILGGFEAKLLEAFTVDGKVYGIPKDYNTSVLFYQKDMFDAAGIAVPKTMDEFVAAAKTLTTSDVFGFGCDPKINYLYPMMATYGADFIGADGSIDVAKLQSDAHKTALTMLKDLFDGGYATSPFLANAGWDGELVGTAKVAMLYGGSWVTGVIADNTKTGVASLPTVNGAYSMLYTAGWSITEQSKSKEAAAQLIAFMSSDEELVAGNMSGLVGLPPKGSAMEQLITAKGDDPFLPVYNEVVKGGVAFGLIDSQFVDAYNKALENMLYNNGSVDDAIAAMVGAVK